VTLRRGLLASMAAAVLLASPAACSSRGHDAAPSGDAGVVAVPNQLRPCENLPACEEACRRGSAPDCLSAANSYSMGDGVPEDEARAAAKFEAACALGSGPGCNLSGRTYEFGHGVPLDVARALVLYERACGLEYLGGCYNVAVLLENGRGAPKDLERALSAYGKVCAAGSQTACAAATRVEDSTHRHVTP
jgi:TPR repeat protein